MRAHVLTAAQGVGVLNTSAWFPRMVPACEAHQGGARMALAEPRSSCRLSSNEHLATVAWAGGMAGSTLGSKMQAQHSRSHTHTDPWDLSGAELVAWLPIPTTARRNRLMHAEQFGRSRRPCDSNGPKSEVPSQNSGRRGAYGIQGNAVKPAADAHGDSPVSVPLAHV